MVDDLTTRRKAHELLTSADALRAGGRITDAVAQLERALELGGALEPPLSAAIRLRLADCFRELNDNEASARAVGPLLDSPPDQVWRARALVRLARVLFFRSDIVSAEQACREALQVLRPTSHHADLALALLWLGHSVRMQGRSVEAEDSFRDALAAARRAEDGVLQAACLNSLGHLCMRSGKLADAERLLLEACDLDERLGHRADVARCTLHLAVCRYHRGDLNGCERTLERAASRYADLADERGQALVWIQKARLARARGEDPSEPLAVAQRFAEASGYKRAQLQVLEQGAWHALDAREYDEARRAFQNLLSQVRLLESDADIAYDASRGLAAAELGCGNPEAARTLAEAAVNASERAGDTLAAESSRVVLARALRELGGDLEAEHLLQDALHSFSSFGARRKLAAAHRAAAACFRADAQRRDAHTFEAARLEAAMGLALQVRPRGEAGLPPAIGPAMKAIIEFARDLWRFDGLVLIEGEPGVGKDLVARAIHEAGPNREEPFLAVNCASLSGESLAAALFGSGGRRGDRRMGAILEAAAGSVLLENVDRLDAELQRGLLHALEVGRVRPVGRTRGAAFRVRVFSSTSRALPALVQSGAFDPGLWHRLAGFVVKVPPLRERPEDVRAIARARAVDMAPDVRDRLLEHDWPGNDRELASALDSALFVAAGRTLTVGMLPEHILRPARPRPATLPAMIEELERSQITTTLQRTAGNKKRAASILGVSRKGLIDRLKRLGLWDEYKA